MSELGDQMEARYKALPIEWHTDECRGRHGVIRNVMPADISKTIETLTWYYGQKPAWRSGNDLEFVHMAKVFPPPTRPWEWCGTSVLFEDWHEKEIRARNAARAYQLSDQVSFAHAGQTHTGIVVYVGKVKVTVLEGRRKWYVPAHLLRHTVLA